MQVVLSLRCFLSELGLVLGDMAGGNFATFRHCWWPLRKGWQDSSIAENIQRMGSLAQRIFR